MRKLLIIGAGGHGKVVGEIAELMEKWCTIAYLDDCEKACLKYPVIGKFQDLKKYSTQFDDVFVAVGDIAMRANLLEKCRNLTMEIVTLIHPSAVISSYATIDKGCVIMANVCINPCVKISEGCIINTAVSIDHDCSIEEFVHISPGCHISGSVHIGSNTWLGTGCTTRNGIHIGDHVVCGCGSNIITNIESHQIVVGNPAKKVRRSH